MQPKRALRIARAISGAAAALVLATVAMMATAAPVRTENVEAELVAERTAIVPGEPLTVALRLKIAPGWHTYWRNPGDSGLPTTLAWKLPTGIEASDIAWPAPRALPAGPLLNYGYEGEALHLVTLTPSRSLASGTSATLAARADWLVCRETCIPEGADLALTIPIASTSAPDAKWSAPIAATRAALPKPLAGWRASAQGNGQTITLALVPQHGAPDPGALHFFAHTDSRIEPSKPQPLARDGDAYVLTLPVSSQLATPFAQLDGVLTASKGLADASGAIVRAAVVDVPLAGSIVAGPKPALAAAPALNLAPPASSNMTLALAIAFALVGGTILNLMPCVFPVLSLKVMGFATHHDSRPTLHAEAIAFAIGVVATFVVLGLALAALRAAGDQLGWGFQLQSPAVVTALAVLFFVLALNMSGVFEFGQLVPSGVAGWTARNRTLDAFGSGVLAVVIASPCTAPLMGAALGYALTGGALTTLAVFVALGVGMAAPYVALALFPGWRRKLPRSGPWLARFKQLLAFPLYGTVIWLAWVLGAQRDVDAVARLLIALLGVGFALWAWHIVRTGGARPWAIVGAAALAGSIVVAWPLVSLETTANANASARATEAAPETDGWRAFSPALVGELAQNRAVFVDFTAAWCVTCQVNKRLVLNSDEIRAAFARNDVALVRADWTKRDDSITRALAALGRNGVPVYVLYRPGKEPLLLPEVLNKRVVLDALATLG